MGETDGIVIIGAGIGGLASALRLGAAGRPVTVLEAAAGPGGKMRALPSPAGPVDAGPTVLTMRPVFEELFAAAGAALDDHVTLIPEPLLARHYWRDGTRLDLWSDAERSADAVGAAFGPTSRREFLAFRAEAARLYDAFDGPVMRSPAPDIRGIATAIARDPGLVAAMAPLRSLAARLRRRFTDPRLRQLYGRYATYVGGSPDASPALLALVSHAEAAGVWRVAGGMHALAAAVADLAERHGARFRYGTAAARIETGGGRVRAVIDATGRRHPCSHAVFAGDPRALATGRVDGARHAVRRAATEPRSLSAEVWAFASAPAGPDLAHHTVFFGGDPRDEFGPVAEGRHPSDPTIYVCAQDRGHGIAPPAIERFETIANAPPLPHPHQEPAACRTRTFAALARHGLTFSPDPPDAALTTPRDFERLFPASMGSLYGRSPHGTMAAFARPTAQSAIPGLILAGGGAHPGAGVPMAALSGRHAAEAILGGRTSPSTSRRTATPGGTSTASPIAGPAPSRSSPS